MCAEGGTGGWHSEVIFSSDSPTGPYKPAPGNPILTQRYLDKNRAYKVDWAGHADLVQTPEGKYYGVFLAVRPNEKNRVNTGRETFMLPVDWSGEFPVFQNGLTPIRPTLKMPGETSYVPENQHCFPNGNFNFTDYFCTPKPDYKWVSLRGPREDFISVSSDGLMIKPFNINIKEAKPTSTLYLRQQHNAFRFTTTMTYMPQSEKDLAGIVCLQSEKFHYVFGITKTGNEYRLLLERTENGKARVLAATKIDVSRMIRLRVEALGDEYSFSYAYNDLDYTNLGGTVSGDILSTDVAGGFTGAMIGLYATSANDIIISNQK
jgi:alpha-N-arabinofuranosidase